MSDAESPPLDEQSEIDRRRLVLIKKSFVNLNKQRLARLKDSLSRQRRDLIDIITLAIHDNHPALPGYVNKSVPSGISDYSPTKASIDAAKRLAKSFKSNRRAHLRRQILAIYIMGSSGTIGYSGESDLDVWVCHHPNLDQESLELLNKKLAALSVWAETIGVSLHFFLMKEDYFKHHQPAPMDKEAAGSTQHYLLLDEFYRTAILLAGRMPLWWMVPPEQANNYQQYANKLLKQRYLKSSDWIDFGPIKSLPAEEFFGAGLWQVYKGIDSPYKSVLKMLLMEVYAASYPNATPLCEDFKQLIYQDQDDPNRVDSYLLIYRKVERYLLSKKDLARLELVRKCFYLKVALKLSSTSVDNWRTKLMLELTEQWSWEADKLLLLDSRSQWKINRVVKERKAIVSELTQCYQFLSAFARKHVALNLINQYEVSILGRKLYAAFERRSGKIEQVNPGIAPNLFEQNLTFHYQVSDSGVASWQLFKQAVDQADIKYHSSIKRSSNLIELISWSIVNGLMSRETNLYLTDSHEQLSLNEFKQVCRSLMRHLPNQHQSSKQQVFEEKACLTSAIIFVNFGLDPLESFTRKGQQLASDFTDAINYGTQQLNLAQSFDLVTINSWGEIVHNAYSGELALTSVMSDWILMLEETEKKPAFDIYCFCKSKPESIAARVQLLWQTLTNSWYPHQAYKGYRFITQYAGQIHLFETKKNRVKHSALENASALHDYLCRPRKRYAPLVIDPHLTIATKLKALFKVCKPYQVQLFFEVLEKQAKVWIIDESGTLFYQECDYHNQKTLLNPFRRFLQSVVYRQHIAQDSRLSPLLKIYHVKSLDHKQAESQVKLKALELADEVGLAPFLQISAIVTSDAADNPIYHFYFADTEYSTLEYGDELFKILAQAIVEERQSEVNYPAYVTDLDISTLDDSQRQITCQYLTIKAELEQKINEAMASL